MAQFVAGNLPHGFPIQKQLHNYACIAAAACSLIAALGGTPPSQAQLDALVHAGMRQGTNGFLSLAEALRYLKHPLSATRHAPPAQSLDSWLHSQAADHQGFLLSSRVQGGGAHITVIFHDQAGNWFEADPGSHTVTGVALSSLQHRYAGDLATLV